MPDQNQVPTFDPNASYQPAPATTNNGVSAFDPNAGYQAAPKTVGDVAGNPTHFYNSATKSIEPLPAVPSAVPAGLQGAPQPTGALAGVKRMTVDALTGVYHAFSDPATEQEKADILQKIRNDNAKGDKISEELATNPSRATLALHRILDAPAATLAKKGQDEVGVARDLLSNHEYWKGGNLYLSGLADKLLSATPVLGPAFNAEAERAERGDISGAVTGALTAGALTNLSPEAEGPAYSAGKAIGNTKVVGGTANAIGDAAATASDAMKNAPGKVAQTAQEIKPEWLTKRGETPAPQHGTPVKVESPLDGPTVGKQLGGKDLSQEALDALNEHAGDKIPVGGTAKGQLLKAVEPVQRTINETASKMNGIVQNAKPFTTSVMQDSVFGEGKLQADIDAVRDNIPPSVRETLSKDIDGVMKDADKALNSNDPTEVLEYRRQLGNKIDWDSIEKNPSTPAEVQNAARAKVYRAIGDKIHSEVPDTVDLDKKLSPNLELRSHMVRKLGERVVDDPHAATVEAQSELKKGQQTVENAEHNEQVAKNWSRIKTALVTAGVGAGALEGIKHLIDLL
jgi:hypothetical protein